MSRRWGHPKGTQKRAALLPFHKRESDAEVQNDANFRCRCL